ncbi:YifB family Mg chelatase-like AAA ATPase [Dongshaea marina]|uniref:YifB family Mg chelatase-like AAA ATPase n=1 Tax=Dongshaea marina TaxID=2047966 RepID=UPI000D3EABFC|nr:YifB family Mg chelatase-like AAA ATPase [Dongshaea marina]
MSLSIINTRACLGVGAPEITVETHLSAGLPGFAIVGLPEASVREARDRVRSALLNSGFTFPSQKITVNLAPADLPKQGGRYDLAVALGILAASEQIPASKLSRYEFLGELALSGEIRPVHGALAATLAAKSANRELILPVENGSESACLQDTSVRTATHLLEVTGFLNGCTELNQPLLEEDSPPELLSDLRDVIGQQHAKRALEIAAAGAHHLLLLGPPGTGKSMLAQRLTGLLPELSEEQARERAVIHSAAGHPVTSYHWYQRPFRAPHHSASPIALAGGGTIPRPGEISLAHHGVLFLDELPEFERRALEILRQPLESGDITISRSAGQLTFPARFQLIAAMNPCPGGYYRGERRRDSPEQILRYLRKLSGPLLDRFDLSVEVAALERGELTHPRAEGESSAEVRERILAAQQRMVSRAGKLNAHLSAAELKQYCTLSEQESLFLENAIHKLGLSVRAWHRILKVSRTIADLSDEPQIAHEHLAEALGYRAMERLLQELSRY